MIKRIPCKVVSSAGGKPFPRAAESKQAETSIDTARSSKRDETACLDDDGEYYPMGLIVDIIID